MKKTFLVWLLILTLCLPTFVACDAVMLPSQQNQVGTENQDESKLPEKEDQPDALQEGLELAIDSETNTYRVANYKGKSANVSIPASYNGKAVTTIDSGAFMNNKDIVNVVIPDSVTNIGENAFKNCANLESLIIGVYESKLNTVGKQAFFGCHKLGTITYAGDENSWNEISRGKDWDKHVGMKTEDKTYSVHFISLSAPVETSPETVLTDYVETEPEKETMVETDTDPEVDTEIETTTVADTEAETEKVTEVECQHPYSKVVAYSAKAPTCTEIGWDAYIVCTKCGMTTYVEKEAMGHVAGAEATCTQAQICVVCSTEITPAFGHTPGDEPTCYTPQVCLTCEAVLQNAKHKFSDGVCTECGGTLQESIGLEFTSYGDGTCYVAGTGTCTDATVVIPEISPDGETVVGIGSRAFYNCQTITSVHIPSTINSIGSYAFYLCSNIEEVHITDLAAWCNVSMSRYSDNPIYYSKNLYVNGELLTDLVIPDGVKSVGTYAFDMCQSLKSVTIPESVEIIGSSAFYGCKNIESIIVDENSQWFCVQNNCLIDIANKKLLRAYGESMIPMDGSVTSIGYGAYSCDDNIESLIIPECITSIDNYAFDKCTNLKTFYYCGTEESFANISKGLGVSTTFSYATIIYNYVLE